MRRMISVAMLALGAVACSEDVSGPNGNGGGIVPSVGDVLTLNVPRDVDDPCTADPDAREGRVVAVTPTSIIVVDTENPSGGLSDEAYATLGDQFDGWGYPVVTQYFGEPSDLDENERVISFFTRAVNEYTDEDDDGVVFGLFWPGDLFPKTGNDGCATSNFGEVLYLAVPGLSGLNADAIRNSAVGTMGHEMQHLVNASRRLYVTPTASSFETIWLNEGLSHATEELMYFERTGSEPGLNIDIEWLSGGGNCVTSNQNPPVSERICAFNQLQLQNFSRFASFLEDPETDAASLLNTEGTLASRGADWHFLRYAVDRRGSEADFWWDLVNTNLIGLQNLTQALGTDPEPWIRDWSAAVYADDEAVDTENYPEFQFPSWNMRDIYPAFERNGNQIYPEYPLTIDELTDADPLDLEIARMAAAYIQVDGPASSTTTVTLSSAALAQLRLSVINASTAEVTQHAGDDAAEVTLEAGALGTTFVLAALNASTTTGAMQLQFASDGAAVVANPGPRGRAFARGSRGSLALAPGAAAGVPLPAINHRFHVEFLERAQRQLTPRIAHARQVYHERERLRDLRY